jgi:hypothetical protein
MGESAAESLSWAPEREGAVPLLRLILMLSAAVYAVLVIYGAPLDETERADAPAVTRAGDAAPAGLLNQRGGSGPRAAVEAEAAVLHLADGRTLQVAAWIDPAGQGHHFNEIARISTIPTAPAADREAATAAAAGSDEALATAAALPVVRVTGSRVNLRAGPSTETDILGALTLGERAEVIASLGNGWAQIRSLDSGLEGYMADRFLTPVN